MNDRQLATAEDFAAAARGLAIAFRSVGEAVAGVAMGLAVGLARLNGGNRFTDYESYARYCEQCEANLAKERR